MKRGLLGHIIRDTKSVDNKSVHAEPRAARLFEIKVVRRGPVTSIVIRL
jgi:hypothetical protein